MQNLSSQRLLLFAILLGLLFVQDSALPEAEAATVHVRTHTSVRATQHLRSDTTLAAPRVFTQGMTLSAYDLRGDGSGDLMARIQLRYVTDFGLAQRLRRDPLFDARFNDISLDLAHLRWHPTDSLRLVGGRHWAPSTLGLTDMDGISVHWQLPDGDWRPFLGAAFGRDVQRGLTPFDPGHFDVQGLPPNDAGVAPDTWHLIGMGRAGVIAHDRHRVELAAQQFRRPQAGLDRRVTTTRLGFSGSTTPVAPVTITAATSYHSTPNALDRAHLATAVRAGAQTFTVGFDQRRPVFDSASIFNLFGAQPHRSAYGSAERTFEPASTRLQLRGWTRQYFDSDPGLFATGDALALGAALAGHHRLSLFIPLQVSWQVSGQTLTDGSGGDQYLADLRLRAPVAVDGLYATGRILGLWALPDHHRRQAGFATTAVVGMELAIADWGRLAVSLESRGGSLATGNAAAFAHFEVDAWR